MQVDAIYGAAARDTSKAVLALTLNAFVWGVSWWPLRELHSHGLHPLWATALVYAVVVTGLLTLRPAAWRGFLAHPQLWFLAAASGLTNVGFNWAVTVGDVVRVVLLFYLMPAWSVLVAWVMLGEKPSAASLLRLLLAMAGVLIVLKAPESPWPVPQGAADWLAIMGGFSFAVTNSVLRKYNHTPSESRMLAMFGGSGLMAAAAALVGMTQAVVPGPALAAAGIPIVLGLSVAFMASNAGLQYGAARLAAGTTAIVMLTEILFASLSSAAMGAAELTPRVLIGGSLIVLAAVLAAIAPNAKSH
ncbi:MULTISPECIES: DMT family transporter [unclassified Polaromonas]|uniref:DMT family transporter n=1 Tax=unclassified Polaromonas TaxID=2638319 RepID=UPI000F08A561|nr:MULTISPECIES: DMT family transporter [unclassified Polaromonas]AYQ27592.1 DMT family transporter [Polaromonas sp. SP1]QGJ17565.1 EamA family transporter [Polaromonas sp. Pch-P]